MNEAKMLMDTQNRKHDHNMTVESLIRTMAPIDDVIDHFMEENTTSELSSGEEYLPDWVSLESQERFSALMASFSESTSKFLPSDRYLRKLLIRYTRRIEQCGGHIEGETLAELLSSQFTSHTTRRSSPFFLDDDIPDPNDSCYVSFHIPRVTDGNIVSGISRTNSSLLGLRIYPQHNDVGVQKVWEAGCCLAEYLLANPHYIRGKDVLELGAGSGLTGLVAAYCGARSVILTDCTENCLENISHNIEVNREFLEENGRDADMVMTDHLGWGEYGNREINVSLKTKRTTTTQQQQQLTPKNANVLLAADVIYDQNEIPNLVCFIKSLLTNEKIAIFASLLRNRDTFQLFCNELEKHGIDCEDVPMGVIKELPNIFPCYFYHPREHVKINMMTINK